MKFFANLLILWSILFSTIIHGQVAPADAQYSGNGNLLINPSFENGKKAWTLGTSNTLTPNTTAANIADLATSAAITTSATVVFNVSQTITTSAGLSGAQGEITAFLKVPSGITDLQLCPLVDAVELTDSCVTIANNNIYKKYNIPIVFGSTSAGIKVKSTATYASGAQTFYMDGTSIKTGISSGTISLDTDWAACTFSTLAWQGLGTVTNTSLQCRRTGPNLEMKGSVTLGTVAASQAQWLLPSNFGTIVTAATTTGESYGTLYKNTAATTTLMNAISTVGVGYFTSSDGLVSQSVNPQTAVNGNTILATGNVVTYSNIKIPILGWSSTSSTYSQANANFSERADGVIGIGAVTTPPTKGTIVTDRWLSSRLGNRLIADAQYDQTASGGAAGSGDYLITLPGGLSFDSNHVFFYTGNLETGAVGTPAKSVVGTGTFYSGTSGSYHGVVSLIAYDATRFRVLLSYANGASGSGSWVIWSSAGVFSLANIVGVNLHIEAPISGWPTGNQIVGNFKSLGDEALISYQVASGTSGGSATAAAWNDRPLNTIDSDLNGIVTSLSSNIVTIPAGTYRVLANAMTNNTNIARLRLRNNTDTSTICQGLNSSDETVNASTPPLQCIFTITAAKGIKLQQWVTTNSGATALGRPATSGDNEVYAQFLIRRIK